MDAGSDDADPTTPEAATPAERAAQQAPEERLAQRAPEQPDAVDGEVGEGTARRWSHRDASTTRQLLVRAARGRFARDGYRSTTVRQIASDVGVSVALINRYFGSKDGLFEACLGQTVSALELESATTPPTLDEIVRRLVTRVAAAPDSDAQLQMLLLLRTSGDETADAIRKSTLESFTDRLVQVASAGHVPDDQLALRAQIAIGTLLGLMVLRTSTGLEPATSASAEDLDGPLAEMLTMLLGSRTTGPR